MPTPEERKSIEAEIKSAIRSAIAGKGIMAMIARTGQNFSLRLSVSGDYSLETTLTPKLYPQQILKAVESAQRISETLKTVNTKYVIANIK